MASAAIVVGNPKARSRTLTVAEEVMLQLSDCLGPASGPAGTDSGNTGPLNDFAATVVSTGWIEIEVL